MDLNINGQKRQVDVDPGKELLFVLRDDLGLTGSKYGCGEGQCGACTVLLDGAPARSCITPVAAAAGKRITTIEGLESGGRLHPVQEAFIESGAMQCGYCIPGQIMSAVAMLNRKPHPTEEEMRRAMEGNLCRCCAYPRILQAIRLAAGRGEAR